MDPVETVLSLGADMQRAMGGEGGSGRGMGDEEDPQARARSLSTLLFAEVLANKPAIMEAIREDDPRGDKAGRLRTILRVLHEYR